MAHVHGAAKTATQHAMMSAGKSGAAMSMTHAGHQMPQVVKHSGAAAVGLATAAAAATPKTGKNFMSILAKHPVLVFGLGMAAGYLAHKYRKEIIDSATRVTEKGKDFVLHQKENLEDLVAECKECADDAGSESPASS